MKPFRLTPLAPLEHDIQGSILVYLAWDRRVAWAHRFNTGAHAITGTNAKGQPTRRFVRYAFPGYAFPGCADILGQLVTGHLLAIEVKRKGGRVRPAQRVFLAQVRAAGGLALLARGLPEVQAGLDHFLGRRASWAATYPPPGSDPEGGRSALRPAGPLWGARAGEGYLGSGVGR